MPDEQLEAGEVAERVRTCYIALVRARGGHWAHYTPGSRQNSFWTEAASICLRHGWNPESHVRALVEVVRNPYPNMLVGEAAVARTERFVLAEPRDELLSIRAQMARLRGCLRVGENIVAVLSDPDEDIGPTLRYYAATQAGLPALASQFRDEARRELRMNPEMRKVLAKLLPGSFVGVLDDADPGRTAAFGDTSGT